jgi:hypothetical protein
LRPTRPSAVATMKPEAYNEEEALMGYVWRNYPDLIRPHECLPKDETICQQLPPELREEYRQYVAECNRILTETAEDERLSKDDSVWEIEPCLPDTSPEIAAAVGPIYAKLRRQLFQERFRPYQDRVTIARCPRCNRILINAKSRQCLWCGFDWHNKM